LLVPLAIAAYAALRLPALRATALAGLGGVGTALAAAWLDSPALHIAGTLTLLAAAALHIGRAARPAANDNADNAAFTAFWSLPEGRLRATHPPRTSSPVLGE
jgi:hypothetical protein